MIFIGFGFLMVFLKTHSWTSVGYNFLIASYALQITIIIVNFIHMASNGEFHKIELSIESLIIGDFGAGAVLISFGAILGKCTLKQLWLLATLEIVFYAINETIGAGKLSAVDMGGSMFVHTFGAYFGLAASYFFQNKGSIGHSKAEGDYYSQLIAMIGTLYLWMFWPSFNGALAAGNAQHRVIVNTVLSISASCIAACGVCRVQLKKLDMEVLLNSTLAGGVAIGSSCDILTQPGVAIAIGASSGVVSALGYLHLNGSLQKNIGLHDTCGVHNLHGMPGIMGALYGSIVIAFADEAFDNDERALHSMFGAMADGRRIPM